MPPLHLLNLLTRNAKRGEFRAEGNVIYLYDVVVGDDFEAEWFGGVSPAGFLRQLKAMSGPVQLRINSPGGDVFAGRAIAQAIREYDGVVTAHVDGVAASIASVVAVACDRVVMAAGSMMMIHKAWTIGFGNADELRDTADLLAKIDGQIAETYAGRAHRALGDAASNAEAFVTLMADETWFTPAEAVTAGLADEEAPDAPKAAKAKANAWDLSAFEHAPADPSNTTLTLRVDASDLRAALEELQALPPAEIRARLGLPDLADPANPVREPDPAALAAAEKDRRARLVDVAAL